MQARVGQYLGNYLLIRLLGQGGYAEVYLGEHRHLKTLAAIKILSAHLAGSEEKDFLAEARTVASLEHEYIIRIFDYDVQDGTPFLVIDYAPNGSLRQRHAKGTRLPLAVVITYVRQIASALHYAHDHKIFHRDVKPENMLVGRDEKIFLSDFGIALIAQTSRVQDTQAIVGTTSYMAPEQLRGRPVLASDQYSLAIVVYEWLTGERPFQGTFVELYSQHLSAHPPSLLEKLPSLPEKLPSLPATLDNVLQIALAKDPTQRFGSVSAFANALAHAAGFSSSSLPAISGPIGPHPPAPAISSNKHTPPAVSAPPVSVSYPINHNPYAQVPYTSEQPQLNQQTQPAPVSPAHPTEPAPAPLPSAPSRPPFPLSQPGLCHPHYATSHAANCS
jgi:serine/threonine protein kinase